MKKGNKSFFLLKDYYVFGNSQKCDIVLKCGQGSLYAAFMMCVNVNMSELCLELRLIVRAEEAQEKESKAKKKIIF